MAKKTQEKPNRLPFLIKTKDIVKKVIGRIKERIRGLLARRPHRSFKKTRRRDYTRSLKLPGYWTFTNYVWKTLWQHKRTFIGLMVIYALLTALLIGVASQETYQQLSDTLYQTSQDVFKGGWGSLGQASLLLVTGVAGAYNENQSDTQQIYSVIITLLTWLTTVWLLRAIYTGNKPKLRDGIYAAGAPIIPTFLVALVGVIQLLPVALTALVFSAGFSMGALEGGAEAMLLWVAGALLGLLSLYWLTSTFFALVVVTLPGMYPMKALRAAGDLVIGRRFRILLRILWLLFSVVAVWAVIMVPLILFDAWIKNVWSALQWVPLVPAAFLILTTVTVVWMASYIYLLYRKVVDDDTAPA